MVCLPSDVAPEVSEDPKLTHVNILLFIRPRRPGSPGCVVRHTYMPDKGKVFQVDDGQ